MKKNIFYLLALLLSILPVIAEAELIQPFVDVLAWKASETNASWATQITFPENSIHVIQNKPNFGTRAGVRAGLLYSPRENCWDTKLYWTHYSTTARNTIPVGPQLVSSLFFSGSFFISEDLFFGGHANWNLDLNTIDLEISHSFHPTCSFSFSPRVGIKWGSINQNININWDAILYKARENLSNDFMGIGPSFGIGAKWVVFQNFSLVADLSTALMYGRWDEDDVYHRPTVLLIIPPTTISTNETQSKLGTMMMNYYLGLEWCHRGQSNVKVKLGYEMQYWPSQLRLLAVQQLPTFGDLTIQGLVCGISIDL